MIQATHTSAKPRRHGTAAVEFAVVAPVLILLITGLWEIGRVVQVKALMVNAAREGCRIAAQAKIVNSNFSYTEIQVSSGTPSVTSTVQTYLSGMGLDSSAATIEFAFINSPTNRQPYQGIKGEQFYVNVSMPYNSFRYSPLQTLFAPATVGARCDWRMLVDDPFSVDTSIPGWTPTALK